MIKQRQNYFHHRVPASSCSGETVLVFEAAGASLRNRPKRARRGMDGIAGIDGIDGQARVCELVLLFGWLTALALEVFAAGRFLKNCGP
jgi:hypothetical protein